VVLIDREELYKMFGPMLIEAIVLIIKDEINILRVEVGLSERTNQQLIDSINNRLSSLSKYDWMNTEV